MYGAIVSTFTLCRRRSSLRSFDLDFVARFKLSLSVHPRLATLTNDQSASGSDDRLLTRSTDVTDQKLFLVVLPSFVVVGESSYHYRVLSPLSSFPHRSQNIRIGADASVCGIVSDYLQFFPLYLASNSYNPCDTSWDKEFPLRSSTSTEGSISPKLGIKSTLPSIRLLAKPRRRFDQVRREPTTSTLMAKW